MIIEDNYLPIRNLAIPSVATVGKLVKWGIKCPHENFAIRFNLV
jgi:hypothetical protein